MKLQVLHLLLIAGVADAFAPSKFGVRPGTARSLGVDPSILHHIPHHVQSLQDAFSSISLSDALDAVQSAAPGASEVVEAAADPGNGWFGFLTGPTEALLDLIHTGFTSAGMTQNSWGVSIIALTLLIKLITFPLTKTQLESTNKMQVRWLIDLAGVFRFIMSKYPKKCSFSYTRTSSFSRCRPCNQLLRRFRPSTQAIPRS
jgi:membrane protein insertase Oxa1/YidC/SpoIIIJ